MIFPSKDTLELFLQGYLLVSSALGARFLIFKHPSYHSAPLALSVCEQGCEEGVVSVQQEQNPPHNIPDLQGKGSNTRFEPAQSLGNPPREAPASSRANSPLTVVFY